MTQNAEVADQEKTKNAPIQEQTTPPNDGVSILKFEMKGVRFEDDSGMQFDTWMLTLSAIHIEDEARIYYKDRRWRFVVFDNAGEKISEIHESAKSFWESHRKRDKGITQDLIEYGFCDEDEVGNLLLKIKEKAEENQALFTDQKNLVKAVEASEQDGSKPTKIMPITASDVISLIESDVLKDDIKNRMFSVNGRPYLVLPHCDGIYEKDFAGIPNYVEMDVDKTTNKLYLLTTKESEPLQAEIQRLCRIKHGLTSKSAHIKEAIMALQGDANQNEKIAVNRIQYLDGALYYDLMRDKDNKIVKMTKDGWKIIPDTSMMNPDCDDYVFMRYDHQLPQVIPSETSDIKLLYKYCSLQDEEATHFLVKHIQVSYFEQIQRALNQFEGPPGSGKTVRTKIMISLIDPSSHKKGHPLRDKTKLSELIRWLHQGYFVAFDNVSEITKAQNDIFAQTVTGLSQDTRALYTNDDGFIYPTFIRSVLLNGISITGTESDVLERSVLFEAHELKKNEDENVLATQFEEEKPQILAAIFDNVCKALSYVDDMKDMEMPNVIRLRDYARHGCAISKAMGYEPEDFLNYYISTFENRDLIALESNSLGIAILEYMYEVGHFNGSLDDLMTHLEIIIRERGLHITADYPMNPKDMGTELKKIQKNLKAAGIIVFKSPKKVNNKRYYVLSYKDFVADSSRKNLFDQSTIVFTPPPDGTVDNKMPNDIGGIKVFT